jgi:hypothetical protein
VGQIGPANYHSPVKAHTTNPQNPKPPVCFLVSLLSPRINPCPGDGKPQRRQEPPRASNRLLVALESRKPLAQLLLEPARRCPSARFLAKLQSFSLSAFLKQPRCRVFVSFSRRVRGSGEEEEEHGREGRREVAGRREDSGWHGQGQEVTGQPLRVRRPPCHCPPSLFLRLLVLVSLVAPLRPPFPVATRARFVLGRDVRARAAFCAFFSIRGVGCWRGLPCSLLSVRCLFAGLLV